MKWLHMVAFLLLFVGGINWGLIGLFHFNLVMYVLGRWPMVESLVYILVGIASVFIIITHKTDCKICGKMMK